MLTENEKKVISVLQKDIPVEKRPYKIMADKVGIEEEEFIKIVKSLEKRKILRRYGATLKHQKSGFKFNAMVAWNIKDEKTELAGNKMASLKEVSHCYKRKRVKDWNYNIYTMIHGKSEEECYQTVKKMSELVEERDFLILFSKEELKKTSMQYFK